MSRPRIKRIILPAIVVIAMLALFGVIYRNRIYREKFCRALIPIDSGNTLAVMEYSTRKGDFRKTLLLRLRDGTRAVWKLPIEQYDRTNFNLYERLYYRTTLLADGKVTFYHPDRNLLYLLDFETGAVLKSSEIRPILPYNTWAALQDGRYLYLLGKEDDESVYLTAVDHRNLEAVWETELTGSGILDGLSAPMMNERWIVFGLKEGLLWKSISIDKETGEKKSCDVPIPGFLLHDFLYYAEAENGTASFYTLELTTGKREHLFTMEDALLPPPFRSAGYRFPVFGFYKEDLIYPHRDTEGEKLKAVSIETGKTEWELPFPPGYHYPLSDYDILYGGAPEVTAFPYIHSRFLPLPLVESSPFGFLNGFSRFSMTSVDLEEGKAVWRSNPVYIPRRELEDNILRNGFYRNGDYYYLLPSPPYEEIGDHMMSISGETGRVNRCFRIDSGRKKARYTISLQTIGVVSPRIIQEGTLYINRYGDTFILDVNSGRLHTSLLRSGQFVDTMSEMGEIYGF